MFSFDVDTHTRTDRPLTQFEVTIIMFTITIKRVLCNTKNNL